MTRRGAVGRGDAPAPESRSLVVVAMASVGIGLFAFVLGMRYGTDRADDAAGPAAVDTLSRLDRQASRLRELRRERAQLSFHETLSGPARKPEPVVAPTAAAAAAPAAARAAAPAPSPEPQAAAAEPSQQQVAAAEPSQAPTPAVEPSQPQELVAVAAGAGAGALVAAAAQPSAGAPAQADPRGAADDPELDGAAQADLAEDEAETEAGLSFSLQVGAFPDAERAEALRQRMQAKGYRAHIAAAAVDGRGTWYRVRVGSFVDREAADAERGKIAASEGLFALVVPEG